MKQVSLIKQHLLSYTDIYGNETIQEPSILLKDIPLVPALETITYMLFRLSTRRKDQKDFHASNLVQWMMLMAEEEKYKISTFIQHYNIFTEPHFFLIERNACLMLIQEILLIAKTSQ